MQDAEDVKMLCAAAREMPVSVVHLIHRSRRWQSNSKDYEFSRRSMLEHWAAGSAAVRKTMHKSGVIAHNLVDGKTAAFDLTKDRSEEHTSELQSLMRISYAVFCLKKKKHHHKPHNKSEKKTT